MEHALTGATDIAELREHLCRPLPALPSRYLYDDRGRALLERLSTVPECYAARTEWRILQALAPRLLEDLQPRHLAVLGSGVGRELRLVLDTLVLRGLPLTCTVIDLDLGSVQSSLERLGLAYAGVRFRHVQASFVDELYRLGPGGDRLVLALGNTLGALHTDAVPGFFTMAAEVMEEGDALLAGVDLVKDAASIEAACNDREGVAAALNLNILQVINERFAADFVPSRFQHQAFYDRERQWVELRLASKVNHKVRIHTADLALNMKKGQQLRTGLSCKYTRASLEDRTRGTGVVVDQWTTDPHGLFALALLRRG